ncbi:MAG: hypothetical protein H7A25_00675 [Leptospiraceae bacterium]|nr:hypothetical protein [Leptospiraceae bacterium]
MNAKSLILVYLFALFSPSLFSIEEKGIKEKQAFSPKNRYEFQIKGFQYSWKTFNEQGELISEGVDEDNSFEITYYKNGRWNGRYLHKPFDSRHKVTPLPPKIKPANLPSDVIFNYDFLKWESGERNKKNRKEGTWVLYWPEGSYAGWINYKDGLYHGKMSFPSLEESNVIEIRVYTHGKLDMVYKVFQKKET